MNKITFGAATALALIFTAGVALADGGGSLPTWATALDDQKLTAVDGSSVTLSAAEDGLTLSRVAPNGAAESTAFAFMSDKLGTISDAKDHVAGFFRVAGDALEAQYADGHTESLFANSGGGLSLAVHTADAACLSWYPAGHVFDESERRAAVIAYAVSLGLEPPVKAKPSVSTCVPAAPAAKAKEVVASSGALAPLAAVTVRDSEVHAVPVAGAVVPVVAVAADAVPAAPLPAQAVAPKLLVSMPAKDKDVGKGASDCLNVESDGSNLGFRNACDFAVQFVYCLKAKDGGLCDIETHAGNVGAKAFAALLPDTNIKPEDAEHNFRWVACSGAASDVTAYLDKAEPPSGRCVKTNAS